MSPSPLIRVSPESGLRRQRHDDAQDDIRALADPERHDRLNVEQRAGGVPLAQAEVPVALERNADQACHRVLRLFRQFVGAFCATARVGNTVSNRTALARIVFVGCGITRLSLSGTPNWLCQYPTSPFPASRPGSGTVWSVQRNDPPR